MTKFTLISDDILLQNSTLINNANNLMTKLIFYNS